MSSGFPYQPGLGRGRVFLVQFPVSHGQVNGDGHGDDQQQRDVVAADDGDLPVHEPKPAGDDQHGESTADQWHHHPAGAAENQKQGQDQKDQNANAEDFQIGANEADHVTGDHRHTAEEQSRLIAVLVHDAAHLLDTLGAFRLQLAAVVAEFP